MYVCRSYLYTSYYPAFICIDVHLVAVVEIDAFDRPSRIGVCRIVGLAVFGDFEGIVFLFTLDPLIIVV